jgi:hypothetical protein
VKIEFCFEAGLDDFKVRRHVEVAWNIKTVMAHAHDLLDAVGTIDKRRWEVCNVGQDRISDRFE